MSGFFANFAASTVEILVTVFTAAAATYGYLYAKKKGKEKKESAIRSEKLLPKPNYLTFVPERNSTSFTPTWEKNGGSRSSGQPSFDIEIEFENEPVKRFSVTHYTTALDSLLAVLLPVSWSIPDDIFLLDFIIREGGSAHEEALYSRTDRLRLAAGRLGDAHQ